VLEQRAPSEDKKARASLTGCFQHRLVFLESEAGENFFLLPNLPEKQKTDRGTAGKSFALC
jgi:hypothetical protein